MRMFAQKETNLTRSGPVYEATYRLNITGTEDYIFRRPIETGALEHRRHSAPPAIFITSPEETEIVMAMDSSRHRTRASEVYNSFTNEDRMRYHYQYDPSVGYVDDGLDVVEESDDDDGWTPVGEVTFRMERSPKKSKAPGSPKMPKIPPVSLPKMSPKKKSAVSSPKITPKEKSPAASPKRTLKGRSPFSSPKGSPKKTLTKAKIESPKKPATASRKILPEIVESNVQQYRPVYQAQILSNENLVPKPYVPRYTGNITARPYKPPVASPRTILPQKENVFTISDIDNEVIKPTKESKDTRGKVKKSLEPTKERDYDTYNAEMKLRSSLTDIKNSIEATLAADKQIAKVSNIDDLLDNSQKACVNHSKPGSPGLFGKNSPIEEPTDNKKNEVNTVSSFSSLDSLDSEEPCSSHSELSAEETFALSVLDAAVDNSSSESFYNCTNKPFNSYNELEMMTERSMDHHSKDIKPQICDSPEKITATENSVIDEVVRHVPHGPSDAAVAAAIDERSVASGNTLSRDSLDGFLCDDMKSLRNFVAQQSLDLNDAQQIVEEKEEEEKEMLKVHREEKHRRNPSQESINFTFEEVEDSPPYVMDSPEICENISDEKKSNKKPPLFSRFTQKVSDKNKENEEKNKTSPFNPRKMLFFGNKDKKLEGKNKGETAKTEGWTSEAIEDYILKNSTEEALRLGLLDEEDLAIQEAKGKNPKAVIKREVPEVKVHEVIKISGSACKKRQAPEPPSRAKSPSWNPHDIENYLLENNMDENLRLGLISKEDIDIYEWKRATGMSPICDTSWTRETLRKNRIVRGSSSSSLSASPVQSTPSSPPQVHPSKSPGEVTTPEVAKTGLSLEVVKKSSSPSKVTRSPQKAGRMAPCPRFSLLMRPVRKEPLTSRHLLLLYILLDGVPELLRLRVFLQCQRLQVPPLIPQSESCSLATSPSEDSSLVRK
ncbi:transcription initiation factor TFIID subunit 3-like isoform X2 [Macrobrachium rosenbergii]|uniref:transcription initiation factor TFIID subunit 3-like isoform X2 n=1 Tax=Macrobrachium rosenbergii TaxID=79674 RepID=UPI0034D3D7B7